MMNEFSKYHPLVNFSYFTIVILCTMFFMHPFSLIISISCGCAYSIILNGKAALKFNLLYMLPMLIVSALINPAFNHEGVTILAYLPNGNPLTLESIAYGISAGTMIVSVICWFSCYNAVMSTDKFVYLFGRIIPSFSLILSMILRFVPMFKNQIKVISNSQKCIGRDVSNGSLLTRMKNGITILSIMITFSLENAIETADSMKSRGYGMRGRTAFLIYRFDKRDKIALFSILSLGAYVIFGAILGGMSYQYFPMMKGVSINLFMKGVPINIYAITVFLGYFLLCATPIIIEVWEDKKWKSMQSNI
ncbi:MAG: energy-coupling factor transporter transmembrane component T [Oscillospiraceae bacterium]